MLNRRRASFFKRKTTGEAPPPGPEAIVWENLLNATADGNDLTATSPDARAQTQQSITEGEYFEYVIPGASVVFTLWGLHETQHVDAFDDYYQHQLAVTSLYVGNVYQTEFAHAAGDTYRLAIEGGALNFYQNGVLQTSSAAYGTGPYFGCVWLADPDQILDAVKGTL